ncbi:MAG: Beta-lactamase superfamily domain protein [Candidatus Hydrogenedentes bacterium ADurb.Bin101]|nr:MAG: Beta-lactamase superfamily domain protein [Candidatus Hydrogenedentes bacterium ADurb.Bin101]HOC70147.1 MBL fold metallo-hydrolase [Candidatus Hydrogenedentota bacterium]
MKIEIHRGSHEIGGSCVELSAGDTRIILDVGMPLVKPDGREFNMRDYDGLSEEELVEASVLPRVEGLYAWQQPSVDAVLISHAHQDHYGLIQYVHPDIPVYMSEGTHKLLEISKIFSGGAMPPTAPRIFAWPSEFQVGEFNITPHLVDHSSAHAFAFEIAAAGKRVFYSGDFRTHGHIGNAAITTLYRKVHPGVDALLMEGTMLGRDTASVQTEAELSLKANEICKQTDKAILIYQAGQNISRTVSFYKAAKRSRRWFVLDLYTACVLDEMSRCPGGKNLPSPCKPGFNDVRVWYPSCLTTRSKNIGHEDIVYKYIARKMVYEEMATDLGKVMLFVRPGMEANLHNIPGLAGSTLVYSLWEGYHEKKNTRKFLEAVGDLGINVVSLHTSGHADIPSLQQMANRLKPRKIIPIHTFHPEEYASIFNFPVETGAELTL